MQARRNIGEQQTVGTAAGGKKRTRQNGTAGGRAAGAVDGGEKPRARPPAGWSTPRAPPPAPHPPCPAGPGSDRRCSPLSGGMPATRASGGSAAQGTAPVPGSQLLGALCLPNATLLPPGSCTARVRTVYTFRQPRLGFGPPLAMTRPARSRVRGLFPDARDVGARMTWFDRRGG